MARITTSIDIGEDLEAMDKPKTQNSDHHTLPNVSLRWHGRSNHSGDADSEDRNHGSPKESSITSNTLMWAAAAMIFVILFSIHQFRATEDFPGIEKAVAKQMNDALTYEVSQNIAKDYKSVSEARKRYMFNQKFDEVSKSGDFKQIVKDKQERTKNLFRDGYGMPYLYSPEAYRYAEAARQYLGTGPKPENERLSEDDLAAGRAIASFHRYSSLIRPTESIEWSAFYLPVAIGAIVVALACLASFFLTRDPASILFTGLALSMHPFAIGMFSAGSPHPSTSYLIPFMLATSMLALASWIKGWAALIPLSIMIAAAASLNTHPLSTFGHILILIAGIVVIHRAIANKSSPKILTGTVLTVLGLLSLYYIGQPTLGLLKIQTLLIGRGVIALAVISTAIAIWGMARQRAGSVELTCAAAAMTGALIVSNNDPSGILPLILACGLIGAAGSHAYKSVTDAFASNSKGKTELMIRGAALALTLLVIAGSSYIAAGSSMGIVLPGVDDSVANASITLMTDASAGAVFLSDPVTSDPVSYISGVRPILVNTSDTRLFSLFSRAMASGDENESRLIIDALTCPAVTESLAKKGDLSTQAITESLKSEKGGCPAQRYLIITDQSYSRLNEYAAQEGIDTQGQRLTMPTQCEIKPAGGIRCGNGFEVLDLNATIQGEFPARMVSFIGNKHIVQYAHNKVKESFVIYRENGKLYSTIVPNNLDGSFLVRAIGHDDIPFLKEISSAENPTHSIVYKIVDKKSTYIDHEPAEDSITTDPP